MFHGLQTMFSRKQGNNTTLFCMLTGADEHIKYFVGNLLKHKNTEVLFFNIIIQGGARIISSQYMLNGKCATCSFAAHLHMYPYCTQLYTVNTTLTRHRQQGIVNTHESRTRHSDRCDTKRDMWAGNLSDVSSPKTESRNAKKNWNVFAKWSSKRIKITLRR